LGALIGGLLPVWETVVTDPLLPDAGRVRATLQRPAVRHPGLFFFFITVIVLLLLPDKTKTA
jgi:hypothetical protein